MPHDTNSGPQPGDSGRNAPAVTWQGRRLRAYVRFVLSSLRRIWHPLRFATLLSVVSLVLSAPFVLDDLVFHAAYLRPSQDAVTITQPTLIAESPRLSILGGTLSVPPALSGQARSVEAIAALIKGGSARLALKAPVFQLEMATQGVEPSPHGTISPMLQALDDATFETLTIRDGTLIFKTGTVVERDVILTDLNADVTMKRKTAMRIKGRFSYLGEVFTFDTTLGSRAGRKGNHYLPVKTQLQSALMTLNIDGRLETEAGLRLSAQTADVQIPNARAVARWLGQPWPSGPGLRNISVAGTLLWSDRKIMMPQGTFRMDGNEAMGTLALSFADARPAVTGTIAFEKLDLKGYGASDPLAPANQSLMGQFRTARDLTLPLLGLVDVDVRASAETILVGPLEAQKAAASLTLHEGQMVLDVVDLGLRSGGHARGEIIIDGFTTTPNYRVKGTLDAGELGDATSALFGFALARGHGDVTADFAASGTSGIDILSKLTGGISFGMPNGGSIMCSAKGLSQAADALDVTEPCRASTIVGPTNARASLTNGLMTISRFEAQTGSETVRMSGTVDLVTQIMDLIGGSSAVTGEPRDVFAVHGRPEALTFGARKP